MEQGVLKHITHITTQPKMEEEPSPPPTPRDLQAIEREMQHLHMREEYWHALYSEIQRKWDDFLMLTDISQCHEFVLDMMTWAASLHGKWQREFKKYGVVYQPYRENEETSQLTSKLMELYVNALVWKHVTFDKHMHWGNWGKSVREIRFGPIDSAHGLWWEVYRLVKKNAVSIIANRHNSYSAFIEDLNKYQDLIPTSVDVIGQEVVENGFIKLSHKRYLILANFMLAFKTMTEFYEHQLNLPYDVFKVVLGTLCEYAKDPSRLQEYLHFLSKNIQDVYTSTLREIAQEKQMKNEEFHSVLYAYQNRPVQVE